MTHADRQADGFHAPTLGRAGRGLPAARALGAVLALAVGLTSPAMVGAQQTEEEPAGAPAARQHAVRLVREAVVAAVRTRVPRALPIGVFDSGTGGLAVLEAEATVEALADPGAGTIGVLATCGTVASGAYPEALAAAARQRGRKPVGVVQQGSIGLAGAIDGLPEFLLAQPRETRPRPESLGPALGHAQAPIDPALLPRYGFDFSQGRMRCEGTPAQPTVLQINSVDNYVAYETVSLLEQLRRRSDAQPLVAVVLGCTHFPYVVPVLREKLRQLYEYQEHGRYVYRGLVSPDVRLIAPAQHVASRLASRLPEVWRLLQEFGGGTP